MRQSVFLRGVIIVILLGITGIVALEYVLELSSSSSSLPLPLPNHNDDQIQLYLENSGPYVGASIPQNNNILGKGIRIAVIDTGIDFSHHDLFGWSDTNDIDQPVKVIGGYNFISEGTPPTDTNGHGTQVAGVIAADGQIKGIAPKAKLLAYKVSEDGKGVSSELIIKAINRAVKDRADIINISLGVNRTNTQIDDAVNRAVQQGILVVTAAGNDGPDRYTIGSPGRSFGSITVGATYNNLTSSLIATLQVDGKEYTAIPMTGTVQLDKPITAGIVFGGYGKETDIQKINATGKIVIVQRGSDVQGELLYFSIKEENTANAGAQALLVYNNVPGIFLGELIHEFIRQGYAPQIPVVSMSQQDGQEIIKSIEGGSNATINLFYNPDFIAHFSSRGPVSPFYIKPDIVAPGAYINTTQNGYLTVIERGGVGVGAGGYNITSGTSYAAPHVSGAAALLMQKYPDLHHHEITSLLLTTVKPVSDAYGTQFSLHDAGTGRLDIKSAYNADMIITPPNFVVSASAAAVVVVAEEEEEASAADHRQQTIQQEFKIKPLGESYGDGITKDDLDIRYISPESIQWTHAVQNDTLLVKINVTKDTAFGEHQGKMIITHRDTQYTVPFIIHYTQGNISTTQQDEKLHFEVSHPDAWNYAKIVIINGRDGTTHATTTATPANNAASVNIYENSEYWINAKIRINGTTTSDAYNIITVTSLDENNAAAAATTAAHIDTIIHTKPMTIIAVILAGIGTIGIIISKRTQRG